MRRGAGRWLALAFALAAVSACSVDPAPAVSADAAGLGNGWRPDHSLALDYATRFRVDFFSPPESPCPSDGRPEDGAESEACQYALIEVADSARYLVVPEGQPAPGGLAPDITVLRRPLTDLYVAASATMSLFVALDALDQVRFSSLAATGWHVPEARRAMERGEIVFGGKYSAPDYELILRSKPSLAVENGMITHSPEVKEKLEALGVPVLVEQSSYEPHPLGRAEWIKLFGVLVGKLALAEELFDAQAAHLDDLDGRPATGQTVAFFHISSAGHVVARKSGDHVAKMIQLAGGEYIFHDLGDDTATSTVNLEMERFYATAKDADHIVYNSTIGGDLGSIADLVALNPLLADFKAVREGHVWCTNKDFYQDMTGLGQVIADLHEMLTDPAAPDRLAFLHRLR
ncbi:MAG: ABC transporter substrate-binding protein [Propionibacteriaceae bacterium]|jgi:iron complex transport system substrate-binding protein|nr:ABC transporter substrate-binding protein [Propionibacteriaceae bacterium]